MIVAGAGIAGSAVTRVLYELGFPVVALDKRAQSADAGLAIFLPGNAIAALDQLGVWDAVADVSCPIRSRQYRTHTDRLLFSVDEVGFWGARNQPRSLLRADLLNLLRGGLPDEAFSYGREIVSVKQEKRGAVLSLSDGAEVVSDKLIAADGVNSVVRASLFPGNHVRNAKLSSFSWRFMVRNPGVDCWTVWLGSRSMVLLIPVGKDTAYGWATSTFPSSPWTGPRLDPDDFRTFPARVRKAIDSAIASPNRIYTSKMTEVRMERWSSDKVLLVGDAAHSTAPVWAQGAALGLSAALTLRNLLQVETLRSVTSSWPAILDRFEREQRPRVEHVAAMTDKMSKAARLPLLLRNLTMPFLGPRTYGATFEPLRTWFSPV